MKLNLNSKIYSFASILILIQACKVMHEKNISGTYSYQGKPVLNLKSDSTFSFNFNTHLNSGSTHGKWNVIDKNIRGRMKFSGIDTYGNDLPDHYILINDSIDLHLKGTRFISVGKVEKISFVVIDGGFDSSGFYNYKVKNPHANVFTIKRPIASDEYDTYWYKVKFKYKAKQLVTVDNIFHPGHKISDSTKLKLKRRK